LKNEHKNKKAFLPLDKRLYYNYNVIIINYLYMNYQTFKNKTIELCEKYEMVDMPGVPVNVRKRAKEYIKIMEDYIASVEQHDIQKEDWQEDYDVKCELLTFFKKWVMCDIADKNIVLYNKLTKFI